MSYEQPADRGIRRFVEGGDGGPLDDRIGRSLRRIAELPGLPDARVTAIGRRLVTTRRWAQRSTFSYAAVVVALLALAGIAAAVVRRNDRKVLYAWAWERRSDAEKTLPIGTGDTPLPLEAAPPPTAAPAASSCPAMHEAPARRSTPPSRTPPPAVPEPASELSETPSESSTLGAEARLLRRAIESLRSEANPRKTLALLEEHRATFPGGRLRANADWLRVEGLLAIGDRREALALLERLPIETAPRGDELLVTRGELRAEVDCGGAVRDFAKALALPLSDKMAERALRGRAVCRVRSGDPSAAEDLRAYVARFPAGKFAARARELLGR